MGTTHWQLWIDGRRVDGPGRETLVYPYDGEAVGTAALADESLLDRACEAARAAAPVLREMPRFRRHALLQGIARRLDARREEMARLITRSSGKPIRLARNEAERAALTFDLAAAETLRMGGEVLPLDIQPAGEGYTAQVYRFPRGPVAAFAPFNFPVNLVAHKLAPALAVGAPVVLKPPPQAPQPALLLAEIFAEAAAETGAPLAAYQVVHCPIPVAGRLAEDPRLPVLSFTGSARVGWALKARVPRKHVVLELGGNAACIVCADADLDRAARRAITGSFAAAGQVCIKVQRIYVEKPVYEAFRERFVALAREVKTGDPEDPEVLCGPLIGREAADRVMAWIDEATRAGARVLCGGTRRGNVVLPTVIEGAPPQARVVCEEVFGPVTAIEAVGGLDEAIDRTNDTPYGLQAGIFTARLDRAYRALKRLEVGGVAVNEIPTFRVDNYPYGGVKDSGLGREGVRYAMDELTEPRVMVLHLGDAAP